VHNLIFIPEQHVFMDAAISAPYGHTVKIKHSPKIIFFLSVILKTVLNYFIIAAFAVPG